MIRLITGALTYISSITKKPAILNNDKYKEMTQAAWLCSSEKAKKILGFECHIGLEEGMQKTAAWYRKNGWLKTR